ncbi:MAG: cysteine-rich small domain-containing protein [Clostridiales bacterium]|nr:cysteine-rich small domain-containing protein [Clostridiales bacterium]
MREGQDWRGKGYSFFQNTRCEYFPCHGVTDETDFNCLFCFCPLYAMDDCGGDFTRTKSGKKACDACVFPHRRENYGRVIARLERVGFR